MAVAYGRWGGVGRGADMKASAPRRMQVPGEARITALLELSAVSLFWSRFNSRRGGVSRALDQLAEDGGNFFEVGGLVEEVVGAGSHALVAVLRLRIIRA